MYKSENNKVNELVRIFTEKGFLSQRYVGDDPEDLTDEDMPYFEKVCTPEVLDACIEEVKNLQDMESFWKWADTSSLFNGAPVLVDNALVLGFGKYLMWDESFYVVCRDLGGVSPSANSYCWLRNAIYDRYNHRAVHFMLSAAMLATGLRYYKEMQPLLSSKSGLELLERMIDQDLRNHYGYSGEAIGMGDLLDCIREYRTDFLPYCADGGDALAVRLGRTGTGDALGVLFMYRSKISVVVKSGAEYVTKEFTVPAWLDEEYEVGEYDAHARAKIMSLLVEFMVRYSGLRLSCAGISSLLCRKGFVEVQCMKEAASVGELVDVVESYYGE